MNKPTAGIDRPAPRTTFAATVGATPPVSSRMPTPFRSPATPKPAAAPAAGKESETERPDDGEKADAPAIPDWGLARKKPRRAMKFKIGAAALLLLGAVAGYVAYSHFFADLPAVDGAAQNGAVAARSDNSDDLDPAAESRGPNDPFDDPLPTVRPAGNSRAPTAREPRRMGTSPDATPIGRRTAATDRTRKNPLLESPALDDDEIPEISDNDEPWGTSRTQSGVADEDSGPALDDRRASHRGRTAATDLEASPARPKIQQNKPSSGPRFSTFGDDDKGLADDLSDEKLDGYSVAGNRTAGSSRRTSGGPSISIVEAHDDFEQDEKFDGFVPQDVTTRRAVSKTLVVRAAETGRQPAGESGPGSAAGRRAAAARSAPFGDDDGFDEAPRTSGSDADEPFARPARGDVNAIQRRSSPPAPAADRRFASSQPAEYSSPGAGPVGDAYRVAPDDNFWKISKKQYGTARYYQALMRHNRERVPDPQKLRPGTQILTPPAAVLEERYPELIERSAPGVPTTSGATGRSAMRPSFEKPLTGDDAGEPISRGRGDAGAGGYFYGRSGEPLYRIGPDDTLTGIAQRHLGRASRWHEIYEKNQDVLPSPDNLTLGTVIRLPSDASRVGLSPDSDRRR